MSDNQQADASQKPAIRTSDQVGGVPEANEASGSAAANQVDIGTGKDKEAGSSSALQPRQKVQEDRDRQKVEAKGSLAVPKSQQAATGQKDAAVRQVVLSKEFHEMV